MTKPLMTARARQAALMTVLAVFAHVNAARADVVCAPYDKVAQGLLRGYGETLIVQGLAVSGKMMQMFANPATGTWTAVMVSPDGMACIATSGADWEAITPGEPT